ncbi:MAG: hypothetical protein PVG88_01630 [Methyloceanibacter sp.]|jgi:hypothetical protein
MDGSNRDSEVARDNYAAYAYARDNGHLTFVEKARRCDAFFEGNQWDPAIRAKLEALGKPVLTINKILSTIAAIWGEQLSHRADVGFHTSSGGNPQTAEAMDKLWLHTVNTNNYDWVESQMAAEGFIRSRGFIDLRADFSDHMRGEARISLLNAKNVLIDPDASEYDPDTWGEVFVTKWLQSREVERVWGKGAVDALSAQGDAQRGYRYDLADWLPDTFGGEFTFGSYEGHQALERRRIFRLIERQYKEAKWADHFVDSMTGDMREIPGTWDRARIARVMEQYGLGIFRKKIDKIRWTVSSGNVTLHDEISPYKHFTPIPFFPFFLHGRTLGIVENLIDPQELFNKAISQELHVINTTANSGWKIKNGSLQNMTEEDLEERGAEDGLVLSLTNVADAEKITPNSIPTGLDRVTYKADESLKEVSMVSDSMRGFDRADVAAKAIRAKQMRGTVSLASPFNNLDQTRRILARNTLDIWQQYYTEPRVYQITGSSVGAESEEIRFNEINAAGEVVNDLTAGEYNITLTTVPARENYEQTQFQEALELRQQGIAIPDDVLVEHSHLNRKSEIAQRLKKLAGGTEPSQEELEAQRVAREMEARLQQAKVESEEADAQLREANAALSAARAQREMVELQQVGREGNQEAMQAALEREKIAAKRESDAASLQLKRMEVLGRLQLERERMEGELAIKRLDQKESAAIKTKQIAQQAKPTSSETKK